MCAWRGSTWPQRGADSVAAMHVLQRIRFPQVASTGALYFTHESTARLDQGPEGLRYVFAPGQALNSSSHQNSFFEFVHSRHGEARDFAFRLHLEGDFDIALWRARFGGQPEQAAAVTRRGLSPEAPVLLSIPAPNAGEENARYYFTLTARSKGCFLGGDVVTTHEPHPVRLAVVLCTFRREDYLRTTVARILADADLAPRLGKIVVVDNGRTLAPGEFADPRVTLIPNRNCGGAGGFSRGMAEVLDKNLGTHILLMDDDIDCDAEALLRTAAFYEHAAGPVAVSGAMLDLQKRHMHFEAGALYGRAADLPGENPLKILGLKRGLVLEQDGALNSLLLDERADYGAFWFFAFPAQYAARCGLALPFFVIGDDIEFGLRLSRTAGVRILPMPGVGVWHAPFYSKISSVKRYFFVRNLLVVDALYNDSSYLDIVRALAADFESDLCKFNYGMVLMLLRAFEDFLRGPGFFTQVDPEGLIDELNKQTRLLDDNLREWTPGETFGFEQPPVESLARTLTRRLTLGGHLLPHALLGGEPMQVLLGGTGQWRKNHLCRRALFLHREGGFSCAREIDGARGRALAGRFARDLWRGRKAWAEARDAWRRQAKALCSPEFWLEYCSRSGNLR